VHDTALQQHALAVLQKLSLRRNAQEALVQAGMVPWISEYLRRHECLSEHAVEYSVSMLMNMCLCRAGRQACEGLPVFDVLDALIQARHIPLCNMLPLSGGRVHLPAACQLQSAPVSCSFGWLLWF
jgi:hypothetical protein